MGLGWFGEPLAKSLFQAGHLILGSTRSEEKKRHLLSHHIQASILNYPDVPNKELIASPIVILNIPPFKEQLDWLKSFQWNPDTWVIFISSTSVYPIPDSKNGHLLKDQEDWIQSYFKHWTILRFGGLMGQDRHPGKYLSGRKNLSGRLWPVNLIHQDDCVNFTKIIIEKNIQHQIINVVSDDHRSREDFYTEYCLKNGLPVPEFDQLDFSIGKLVPNNEMKKIIYN